MSKLLSILAMVVVYASIDSVGQALSSAGDPWTAVHSAMAHGMLLPVILAAPLAWLVHGQR